MQRTTIALSTLAVFVGVAHEPPETDAVQVRIVVTDARGKHVTALSAADIQIAEGGQSREVRSFAAAKGPRRIGILLDEYHVSPGAPAERAAAALNDFIARRVRGDDMVFVTRPLDPASSIAPARTLDDARAVLSAFEGRKGEYAPRTPFESEYLSATPPTAARQRAQIVRSAMQALATAMTRGPAPSGPAAMILITEGFPDDRPGRERLATLRTAARAARMANVATYVIDPSNAAGESAFGEGWQGLVSQTGGLLTTGGASLTSALERVAADLDGSYVLTIAAPEKEDGAYRRLEVRTARKDLTVRAPSGYWAPIAAERYTLPERPAMSTFLKTPHITGLIQPWFRMTRSADGRTAVTFSWIPRPGRAPAAAVAFSAVTFDGRPLTEATITAQKTNEAGTRIAFEAPPGPIQVSMAITDAAGRLLGSEVRYIDVPALTSTAAMIAAVEVVRTRTLREFLERQLLPDVMPVDTTEFDRRDRLIVRVRAFSATEAAPTVRATLLNPLGHRIRDLAPLPDVEGMPQFDLPLASYPKGDYRIEVRATSGASSTARLLMFRLIG